MPWSRRAVSSRCCSRRPELVSPSAPVPLLLDRGRPLAHRSRGRWPVLGLAWSRVMVAANEPSARRSELSTHPSRHPLPRCGPDLVFLPVVVGPTGCSGTRRSNRLSRHWGVRVGGLQLGRPRLPVRGKSVRRGWDPRKDDPPPVPTARSWRAEALASAIGPARCGGGRIRHHDQRFWPNEPPHLPNRSRQRQTDRDRHAPSGAAGRRFRLAVLTQPTIRLSQSVSPMGSLAWTSWRTEASL